MPLSIWAWDFFTCLYIPYPVTCDCFKAERTENVLQIFGRAIRLLRICASDNLQAPRGNYGND